MVAIFRATLLLLCILTLANCAPRRAAQPTEQPVIEYFDHQVSFSGETLALIAKWYTGDSDNWNEILAHNAGLDVRKMAIGQVIKIPRSMLVRETKLTRNSFNSSTTNKNSKKSEPTQANNKESSVSKDDAKPDSDKQKKALRNVLDEISDDAIPATQPGVDQVKSAVTESVVNKEPLVQKSVEVKEPAPIKEPVAEIIKEAPQVAPTGVAPVITAPGQVNKQGEGKPKTRYDLLKELLEQKQ